MAKNIGSRRYPGKYPAETPTSDFPAILVGFGPHTIPWNFEEVRGTSWDFVGLRADFEELRGLRARIPWNFEELRGTSRNAVAGV